MRSRSRPHDARGRRLARERAGAGRGPRPCGRAHVLRPGVFPGRLFPPAPRMSAPAMPPLCSHRHRDRPSQQWDGSGIGEPGSASDGERDGNGRRSWEAWEDQLRVCLVGSHGDGTSPERGSSRHCESFVALVALVSLLLAAGACAVPRPRRIGLRGLVRGTTRRSKQPRWRRFSAALQAGWRLASDTSPRPSHCRALSSTATRGSGVSGWDASPARGG